MLFDSETVHETGGRRYVLELSGREVDDLEMHLRPHERALLAVLGYEDAPVADKLLGLSLVCRILEPGRQG